MNFSSFVAFKRTVQQIDVMSFFNVVSKLRFTGSLLVPLRGLIIHSHIVLVYSRVLVLLFRLMCVRIK